jgi:pimeloyl-ACP methyl ester carboxylesterase
VEGGLVQHDGGALAWEFAEGPDVVFLHPGLWDGRVWDEEAARLEQIEAPTFVIHADNDPLVFRRLSAILAERIPDAGSCRSPRRTMSSTCDERPSSITSFSGSLARCCER